MRRGGFCFFRGSSLTRRTQQENREPRPLLRSQRRRLINNAPNVLFEPLGAQVTAQRRYLGLRVMVADSSGDFGSGLLPGHGSSRACGVRVCSEETLTRAKPVHGEQVRRPEVNLPLMAPRDG